MNDLPIYLFPQPMPALVPLGNLTTSERPHEVGDSQPGLPRILPPRSNHSDNQPTQALPVSTFPSVAAGKV